MLGVIKVKYNIRLSRLAGMRTEIDMMILDYIIFQKLSRIFMPIISINHDFKKEPKSEKRIDLLKRPRIQKKEKCADLQPYYSLLYI